MAYHTPPFKKVKKQGEMPLPSLGPIPLNLAGNASQVDCDWNFLGGKKCWLQCQVLPQVMGMYQRASDVVSE